MTIQEFSTEFDTVLNNTRTLDRFAEQIGSFGYTFDEYEKSLFLTKAQEEIVKELYTGKNAFADSFEKTEEIRRSLADLIVSTKITTLSDSNDATRELLYPSGVSQVATLPTDVLYVTLEWAHYQTGDGSCGKKGEEVEVVPMSQDYYHRVKDNPFRGKRYRRTLRYDLNNNKVELVSQYPLNDYCIRYIKKPNPIILVDLNEGTETLEIDGKSTPQTIETPDIIHRQIVERAVKLALQSRVSQGGTNK